MSRYAANTEVSSDKSRAEIEKTLIRYGADGLIAVDRANAARRRLIRNRCNMRKKQAK